LTELTAIRTTAAADGAFPPPRQNSSPGAPSRSIHGEGRARAILVEVAQSGGGTWGRGALGSVAALKAAQASAVATDDAAVESLHNLLVKADTVLDAQLTTEAISRAVVAGNERRALFSAVTDFVKATAVERFRSVPPLPLKAS
jgi:hypothetical protein